MTQNDEITTLWVHLRVKLLFRKLQRNVALSWEYHLKASLLYYWYQIACCGPLIELQASKMTKSLLLELYNYGYFRVFVAENTQKEAEKEHALKSVGGSQPKFLESTVTTVE